MRFALVNPRWSFDGSIYFGCREPHLPLEYGYAKRLLEDEGHQVTIIDGHMFSLHDTEIRAALSTFAPDFTVITTAPSYLFWRCAPPELRVPQKLIEEIRSVAGIAVAIGPHCSTTPRTALRKLGVDVVVLGEAEEILPELARADRSAWKDIASIGWWCDGEISVQGPPRQSNMARLPALSWPDEAVVRHTHHHHRFESQPVGSGAEMEVSRGCPYHCTFCAKDNFRSDYRRRPAETIIQELDALIQQGVRYVYFIDEIFLPDEALLRRLITRHIPFGIQTRIDLWKPELLELLGKAGCVSIEAGVESISPEGRDSLNKNCKMSTAQLTHRLIIAKQHVPFVQANLIESRMDEAEAVDEWRATLEKAGIWANKPVPLFPYPGSPDYDIRWGKPDDLAWERAHAYYLNMHQRFSDIQNEKPAALHELETVPVRDYD